MSIEFDCPHCGKHFQVPDKFAGRTGKCKMCGTAARVPAPQPIAPAASVSERIPSPAVPISKPANGSPAQTFDDDDDLYFLTPNPARSRMNGHQSTAPPASPPNKPPNGTPSREKGSPDDATHSATLRGNVSAEEKVSVQRLFPGIISR